MDSFTPDPGHLADREFAGDSGETDPRDEWKPCCLKTQVVESAAFQSAGSRMAFRGYFRLHPCRRCCCSSGVERLWDLESISIEKSKPGASGTDAPADSGKIFSLSLGGHVRVVGFSTRPVVVFTP